MTEGWTVGASHDRGVESGHITRQRGGQWAVGISHDRGVDGGSIT